METKVISLRGRVALEMVYIPPGTFTMGSSEEFEGPEHQVTLPGFWMGKYPITQTQYQAVMGNNPARFKGEGKPVEQVSWHDATEFCSRLSKEVGECYILPTSSQWEYACRAGTTTQFYLGDNISIKDVNFDDDSTESFKETTCVGTFPPNAFGLYDMHGNVWEWCLDTWHKSYHNAPADGSAWMSTVHNIPRRIIRGGSWSCSSWYCRSACFTFSHPKDLSDDFGFRIVSRAA
jgi:formylglycine-generating enzyme required for sulfatase activity